MKTIALLAACLFAAVVCITAQPQASNKKADKQRLVGPRDWNQWGGSSSRNNTPEGKNIPMTWDIGEIDEETGQWKPGSGKNIKWAATLGSQTYGNPVVANGQVYVGTNNGNGWVKKYPKTVDLGCLLCFRESDGKFLWQHSNEKLARGRVVDSTRSATSKSAADRGADRHRHAYNPSHISRFGLRCHISTSHLARNVRRGPQPPPRHRPQPAESSGR